jgi:hypothetical protein
MIQLVYFLARLALLDPVFGRTCASLTAILMARFPAAQLVLMAAERIIKAAGAALLGQPLPALAPSPAPSTSGSASRRPSAMSQISTVSTGTNVSQWAFPSNASAESNIGGSKGALSAVGPGPHTTSLAKELLAKLLASQQEPLASAVAEHVAQAVFAVPSELASTLGVADILSHMSDERRLQLKARPPAQRRDPDSGPAEKFRASSSSRVSLDTT